MTDRPQLLPCPFCGADEASVDEQGSPNSWMVVCPACAASSDYKGSANRAAKAWNLRTPDFDEAILQAARRVQEKLLHAYDSDEYENAKFDDATLLRIAKGE